MCCCSSVHSSVHSDVQKYALSALFLYTLWPLSLLMLANLPKRLLKAKPGAKFETSSFQSLLRV